MEQEKSKMDHGNGAPMVIAVCTLFIVILVAIANSDNTTNKTVDNIGNTANETLIAPEQTETGISEADKKRYMEWCVNDSIEYARYSKEYFMSFAYANDNTKITEALSKLDYSARCPSAFVQESPRAQAIEKHIQKKCEMILNHVMPSYRKRYAENLDAVMWEYNMDVYASSSRYEWLNLTGYMFADNGTIKQYYELMKYKAKSLGFTRICFRWYEGQDEYQYFTIE